MTVPAVAVPLPPDVDRVPARLGPGEVLEPPAPPASTLGRSVPTRLHIPAIGVESELVGLGLQDDGRMEVPPGAYPAGWYTGAPTPGELGPAILAGHVDHGGRAGVFWRLRELQPGDTVEVGRADGATAVFRVTRVEQHAKDAFPTAAVYGDLDHAGLRLITCGGAFDRDAHSYEDNIVVFAELDTRR
ncbi:MAG: class F sortase [Actinobacteria bacterium]|nr:class F sortase [Actinomycetota bacterium]